MLQHCVPGIILYMSEGPFSSLSVCDILGGAVNLLDVLGERLALIYSWICQLNVHYLAVFDRPGPLQSFSKALIT